MVHPALLILVSLPLTFRLIPLVVPARWLEPYAYWSAASLNIRPGDDGPRSQWRNMGWWMDTDVYSGAAETLARKLLVFADAEPGGNVLDVAHGAGESLALHLSISPPPAHLSALTSQPSETLAAQALTSERFPNATTNIDWYIGSASYSAGKDLDHPLNPMRGYLGKRDIAQAPFESDDPESEPDEVSAPAPPPYDLVYILDAIYHFPPSVPYFLASVLPALRPGSGVIAYTDILPPPHVNAALGHLVLPTVLGVPARNLMQRPKTLEAYEALLGRIGFEDVVVEDWSQGVWPGFAKNLRDRGGVWATVGRGISAAESTGWRFIAARARRPHLNATNNAY